MNVEGEGSGGLSAAEEAFFSSGGETEIPRDDDAGAGAGDGGNPPADSGADKGGEGDGKPADKPADKVPVTVPLSALHEERNRRKDLDKRLRDSETALAELRGKFSIIDKLNAKGDGENDALAGPPTAEEDIFGKVKHTDETVAQIQKRLDDAEAANKAKEEQTTFVTNYRADADAFQAKNPDYRPAYNFLLSARASELLAIGFDDPKALAEGGATQEEVHAAAKALHDALVADEMAIADLAFKKKKSPAEIIYGLAKQRGYKAAAAGDGKGDAKPKAEEQLERIERGQNAAGKSLNGAGAGSGDGDMTAERRQVQYAVRRQRH